MTEVKDRRSGWVRDLKVGDEVAFGTGSPSNPNWGMGKIVKVTPVGAMDVHVNMTRRFKPDGSHNVSGTFGKVYYLTPVTDEIRAHCRRQNLIYLIKNKRDLNKLSTTQLEIVNKMLRDAEEVDRALKILNIELEGVGND